MAEIINENEYIYMIHQNDERALALLIQLYEESINYVIYHYKKQNMRMWDRGDLKQIACLKLLQAIDCYCEDYAATFKTYFIEIFRREIVDLYRKTITYKGKYHEFEVSLDMCINEKEAMYTYMDLLELPENKNCEISSLLCDIHHQYPTLQYEVLVLRVKGYTYQEIANFLHINEKKVDNILARIRKDKKKITMN